MKRAWALIAVFALGACQDQEPAAPGPVVGSNSNWHQVCASATDCSAPEIPECACGVCTVECTVDADCAELKDARCALELHPAARSVCESAVQSLPAGLCLPRCVPGSCTATQACADGACVPTAVPDNAFCALGEPPALVRTREEELLELFNQHRFAGDLECGGAPTTIQPTLRLVPRMMCSARVLAADMARTRALSVVDSEGRDTSARLELADYTPTFWYEAFAVEADSAQHALDIMLADATTCGELTSSNYLDIGIGNVDDVFVLLVAR